MIADALALLSRLALTADAGGVLISVAVVEGGLFKVTTGGVNRDSASDEVGL